MGQTGRKHDRFADTISYCCSGARFSFLLFPSPVYF